MHRRKNDNMLVIRGSKHEKTLGNAPENECARFSECLVLNKTTRLILPRGYFPYFYGFIPRRRYEKIPRGHKTNGGYIVVMT